MAFGNSIISPKADIVATENKYPLPRLSVLMAAIRLKTAQSIYWDMKCSICSTPEDILEYLCVLRDERRLN